MDSSKLIPMRPRSSLVGQEAAREKAKRENVVLQQYNAATHAVLLNASGHVLPANTYEYLQSEGFKTFSSFSVQCHVEVEQDLWAQALDMCRALGKQVEPNLECLAFQVRGTRFFFPPARGHIAIMCFTALTEMCGVAPRLPIIGYEAELSDYKVHQCQNMPAFLGCARGLLRAELILGVESGITEAKIAENSQRKAERIKSMPKLK